MAIPNANAPLGDLAVYERALVPGPNHLATLVKYDLQRQRGPSYVLFDGTGAIASDVAPEHAESLGRLETCVREAASAEGESRDYAVLSTPAPTDYSITVEGTVIAIPSGAAAGRLSNDLPEDFRTIARGASFINLNNAGISDAHIVEQDAEDFGPLFGSLSALPAADFLDVVAGLDQLPYPPLPLPVNLPVTSITSAAN